MFLLAAASSSDLPGIAFAVLGIAGLAGGAIAYFRVKGTQATIDLLEQSVRIERTERQALEARCRADSAVLEGKISVLTEQFAHVIAEAVVKRLP